MRIISGRSKGKKLGGPPDAETTRPIPDRVKESLFGLLRGHCEGARVLDLFAGTGGIGLEAWSRGASRVVFVERDRAIAKILEQNLERVGRPVECELVVGDALSPSVLTRCPAPLNLAFADPPYALVRDPAGWRRVREQFMRVIDLLSDDGFASLRTPRPFVHEAGGAGRSVGVGPGVDRRTRNRRHGEADEPEEESPGARADHPEPVGVDLFMDNAEGPETHVYGSTAIHLYMRKRAE
jgi:16S rRNA (guanine(966)-N(2))-methyltransferase RsmD